MNSQNYPVPPISEQPHKKEDPTWIDGKMNSKQSETYIGTAAVIVGCLVSQDYLRINLEKHGSDEEYMNAIRLVAAVLRRIHPRDEGCDWPNSIIPF